MHINPDGTTLPPDGNEPERSAVPDDPSAATSPVKPDVGEKTQSYRDRSKSQGRAAPQEMPAFLGRYKILSLLGRGGFGTVYLGHDDQLDRKVAVKVPHGELDPDKVESFLREARRLAKLRHPGIVTVHDVGVDAGRCYIVSDFIRGQSLRDWMQSHRPTWQEAVRIVAAVADALAEAHKQSTVHRDVKPSNITLTEDLKPILLDFGLC